MIVTQKLSQNILSDYNTSYIHTIYNFCFLMPTTILALQKKVSKMLPVDAKLVNYINNDKFDLNFKFKFNR